MKEYIEREALFRFLTEQKDKETGAYSMGRNAGLDVARSALHNREITPAADVVERKRGEWVQIGYDDLMDRITCSCCKEYFSIIDNCTEEFNFCPNCGADMRSHQMFLCDQNEGEGHADNHD